MYRIIGADQREYGPVSAEDLRRWIQEGRVNGQTRAWLPGMKEWRPLSAFPEFSGAFPPTIYQSPTYSQQSTTNGMAVTGFIFGLLGLPCCMTFAFPMLGFIFSIIGIVQTGGEQAPRGRGLAVAGLILSLLGLLTCLFLWIASAIGAAANSGGHGYNL